MYLAELLDRSGLDVLDHLDREASIPVVNGIQAQGDLIVIPFDLLGTVRLASWATWSPVPADGVELVRGEAGNNPHTLVADPGSCQWTSGVHDPLRLTVAVFANSAPAYLVHPEHGGTGVAPGRWLIRRQQESRQFTGRIGVALRPSTTVLVAD